MTLSEEILQAMKDYENEKPRNHQVALGPSELGGCREYIRNVMIGTPVQGNDEWPTAAVVGGLIGEYMENVLVAKMGAQKEIPVTTTLPNGIKVTGHADIVLAHRNCVVDCKTKNELHEVLRDGSSLDNKVQVSIYTLGLVQRGILQPGATAHLVYVDRSGTQQFLHESVLTWDDIQNYVNECVERLNDVLEVQEHIDQGEVEYARDLRDKTPPFCYSPRVMCPFRDLCWKGSEWVPSEEITDPEIIGLVERYAEVRDEQNAATSIRRELKEKLVGVTGVTPSGWAVTWPGDGRALYVTQVKGKK